MSLPNDETSRPIEIKDLFFSEQALVWGLRMKVRGEKFFDKVRIEFDNNLPPSARRIAIEAINSTIRLVQIHGKKPIKLNCTCVPYLSPDEWLLVRILRKVNQDPSAPWPISHADFIAEDGRDSLIHALLSFQMALDLTHHIPNPEMTLRSQPIKQAYSRSTITIH